MDSDTKFFFTDSLPALLDLASLKRRHKQEVGVANRLVVVFFLFEGNVPLSRRPRY
jgi:hypothetical protein